MTNTTNTTPTNGKPVTVTAHHCDHARTIEVRTVTAAELPAYLRQLDRERADYETDAVRSKPRRKASK